MKRFAFVRMIVVVMASLMMFACHETLEGQENNHSQDDAGGETVNILFLPKASSYNGSVPRMVSNVGDMFFIEQTTPGQSDTKTLQMIDRQSGCTYVAILTAKSALIFPYPEDGVQPASQVLMASQSDEGMRLALCNMLDWEQGQYEIVSETFLEAGVTRSSYGDMDFVARSMDKLLLDIGSGVDTMGDVGGVLNIPVIKNITSAYSLIGINSARLMLWQDDPEMLEEVRAKTIKDATTSFILNLLPSSLQRVWHGCRLAFNWGGGDWWSQTGFDVGESDLNEGDANDGPHLRVRRLSEITDNTHSLRTDFEKSKPKYIVTMGISNVGETSATFSGSFRLNDGNETGFIEMGYVLKDSRGISRTINSWELRSVSLTDLEPGTTYKVYAYVSTMFGIFQSPEQEFTTEGKLIVSPTSISFDYKGGTKGIAVTVGPKMTWEVTSMPGWCTKDGQADGSFYVKVGATKDARRGTIVITATTPSGKTRTASVSVEQSAEPIEIQGFAMFRFSGNVDTKIHLVTWRNGIKEKDDTEYLDPYSSEAIVMIQNGKYILTAGIGPIAFVQWEVGSTPPAPLDYDSYQEFNQSYTDKEITISGKCHKRRNNTSGWEEDNVSFSLIVSALNTSTPSLTSEWYDHDESYQTYSNNNVKSLSETWFTQNLSGTKLY